MRDPAQVLGGLAGDRPQRVGGIRPGGLALLLVGAVLAPAGVEARQQRHHPEAVGGGVVHLQQVRSLAVGEPFEQHHLPRGSGPVEGGHGDLLGGDQQRRPGGGLGQPGTAHVVVEVEVVVDGPSGDRPADGALRHPLAEARHQAGGPVVGLDQAIPVGSGVEQLQTDHGGAKGRVGLPPPHDGVEGAERLRPTENRTLAAAPGRISGDHGDLPLWRTSPFKLRDGPAAGHRGVFPAPGVPGRPVPAPGVPCPRRSLPPGGARPRPRPALAPCPLPARRPCRLPTV